jgi:ketosteroid isomerase-like protein
MEAITLSFYRLAIVIHYGSMATPQTQMPEAIRLAMASTNDLFNREVFAKRNFEALDQVYTAGARILPPGAPLVEGREGIKKFWSDTVLALDAKSAVLASLIVMPAGDGVVEIGKATLSLNSGAEVEAKYVVYWKNEAGLWKWHVDIWNFNA